MSPEFTCWFGGVGYFLLGGALGVLLMPLTLIGLGAYFTSQQQKGVSHEQGPSRV